MGEIIVNQKSGQLSLQSFNPLISVTKAEHSQELMSTDKIDISVQSSVPLSFNIGDFIEHEGRRFTLNLNPKVNKQNESRFIYDLIFEGVQYDLLRKVFFNYDAAGNYTTADFPLTGNLETHLICLRNNANRDIKENDFTWYLDELLSDTDTKTITFNNTNCLAALQNICKEFELEFNIVQDIARKENIISVVKKTGGVLPFTFEYGYKNGLYYLTRDRVSDGQVTTRLYPYGSSENIPTNYRNFSPRLKLPTSYGKDYIQDDAKVLLYGLNEEIINYDDIKPTFKGVLSGVGSVINANNTFDIVVGNMDFDLNEKKPDGSTKYLIAGTPAKLHVNKGNLAGYEFEIHSYDHATKKFQVKVQADERGQKFPDLATIFKFAVGDEIVLIDIILPQIYIDNAETKLKDKAIDDYAVKSQNNVKYALDIDPMFLVELGYTEYTKILGIGDYVGIKDTQLSVDKSSRIVSLKRDLLNPFKYSADISDTYEIGLVTQIVQEIQNVQTQIHTQTQVNTQAMLSGYRRMLELQGLVFDTDGKFDMANFAAGSITTSMLSVGARSQELTLKDVVFTPNKDGNVNNISISAGSLIHFSIDQSGIKTWSLAALNQTGLIASNSYYIYARVSRSGNTGTYVVTTEQRKFDQESGFYNFLLGVLFQPQNGVRLIHLNYGATYINGRVITTGRIASIDGLNWFDLDTGEFRGKFIFTDGTNVQGAVNNAASAAAAAQATANNAINQINDIGSDNKLTPNEKQVLINEWNRIKIEYSQNSTIANTLNLSIINYQSAYNALDTYITPLLANLTTTSDIVGSTFRTNFQNYYNQNVAIVTAIENKKIENIQIGGRNYLRNSGSPIKKIDFWVSYSNSTVEISSNELRLTATGSNARIFNNTYIPLKNIAQDYILTVYYRSGYFLSNVFGKYSESLNSGESANNVVVSLISDKDLGSNERVSIYAIKAKAKDSDVSFRVGLWLQNSQVAVINKIKLEEGNKSTDWIPSVEDVQSQIDTNTANTATALAQAQNAINTANNVANLTSFLQTSIQGNVVGTGTLLVGDVLGANAMICGVTDRPNGESIRFGAGKPYDQKYNSPFQVLDNGMIRFVNPITGKVVFELGYNKNTGKVVFDIYNESGVKVATIGSSGIEFMGYIPEKFTQYNLRKLTTTSFTESAIKAEMLTNLGKEIISTNTGNNQYHIGIIKNKESFFYDAGRNFESADNSQYIGYHNTANRFDSWIDDGIYAKQTILSGEDNGDINNYFTYTLTVFKIINGQVANMLSFDMSVMYRNMGFVTFDSSDFN